MNAFSLMRSLEDSRAAARLTLTLALLGAGTVAVAETLDYFGPPPADDPSAWTGPIVSEGLADDLTNQPPVYKGAIEGGPTGTASDQGFTGLISEDELDGGRALHAKDAALRGIRHAGFGSHHHAVVGVPTTGRRTLPCPGSVRPREERSRPRGA